MYKRQDLAQIGRERIEMGLRTLHETAIRRRENAAIEHPMIPAAPKKEFGQHQTVEESVLPSIGTAEPESTPAPSAKMPVAAKVLASAEVDDWLVRIRRLRRRITRRDGRTEPFEINDLDRRMLDLASAEQMKELDLIRDRQNRLVGRIVEVVKAEPGILTIPADPGGKWTLAHDGRDLQDGLRCYIADPDVQGRLRNARGKGLERQAATRQAPPQVLARSTRLPARICRFTGRTTA